MPRRRVPKYRCYKPKNLGLVVLSGKPYYLGKYGTPESVAEYNRLIQEWLTEGPASPVLPGKPTAPTVNEVLLAFWRHAEQHYKTPDGVPTGELDNLRNAFRPLRKLYGQTLAREFGPLGLRAVQQAMIEAELARTTINARVNRIRRVFKWAVSREFVPPSVYQAIQTVPGLQRGRCNAVEAKKMAPVSMEHVEATMPCLPSTVAALVQVQLLSGCRAGEAMVLRADKIDMTGAVWVYRPHKHKNQYRGLDRVIYLGPKAQEVLLPFVRVCCPCCGLVDRAARIAWQGDQCGPCADRHEEEEIAGPWPHVEVPGDYYLLSPQTYVEDLRARRAAARKTKRTPSELKRKRKAQPKRQPAERYNRRSYRLAIVRAADQVTQERFLALLKGPGEAGKLVLPEGLTYEQLLRRKRLLTPARIRGIAAANGLEAELERVRVPHWSPLQLRHTAATAIRAMYGVEAAKVILGHTRVETSEIYAERDLARAAQIMREIG